MKQIFTNPEVRITRFCTENVIIASGIDAQNAITGSDKNVSNGNTTVVGSPLNFE